MKNFLLAIAAFCLFNLSYAQDTDTTRFWKTGGLFSVNVNQVSLVNWAAGGENSFSGTVLFNSFINYKRERVVWDNSLDVGYGIIKLGDHAVQKNEDRIIFNSKYGKQMFSKVYLSTLLNFRSQFAPGYNLPNDSIRVSEFLAPAFLILSVGIDIRPTNFFSLYFSPATGKFTIVRNQTLANAGMYGVDPAIYSPSGELIKLGEKFRGEFGAYLSAKFEKEVATNITIKSILDLFNNYTDKVRENRGNIDVNWETNINFKVNKYISATLFTHLIYDHDMLVPLYSDVSGVRTETGKGRRVQFKEVFGISFGYKF